jgi:hypothetical protein
LAHPLITPKSEFQNKEVQGAKNGRLQGSQD